MALEFAALLRNAMLDAFESHIGTSALFKVFTGSPPADCATADSGTQLAGITCPSDWMAAASSGAVSKTGTWQDTSADASGTPGYWRLYTSGGTCKAQGTAAVGSGDLNFDATITSGGTVTISTFTLTAGNVDT